MATGTGLVAINVARQFVLKGSAIGIDISSAMLAQTRNKMFAGGINNLKLIEADIELIDSAPEQFDAIFCCSAIMCVSNILQLPNKCYR